MRDVTSTFYANDAPDHSPNDFDDWLIFTSNDMNCPGCTGATYADNDGEFICGSEEGVQFSGVLAGEEGNDGQELNTDIIDSVFHSEHGEMLRPGIYHQSAIQSVIEKGLDSISIPRGVRLQIFEEGPSSPILMTLTGPAIIQNTLHHPLHSRVNNYTVPLNEDGSACMLELRSCDLAARWDNLEENMYLWFGDCAPRRWFQIGCTCPPCPPEKLIKAGYGKNLCEEPPAILECEDTSRAFDNCPDWDPEGLYCRSATTEECYEQPAGQPLICEADVVKYDGKIWGFDHDNFNYDGLEDCAKKGRPPGTSGTDNWVEITNQTTGLAGNGIAYKNCCSPCTFDGCARWETETPYEVGTRVNLPDVQAFIYECAEAHGSSSDPREDPSSLVLEGSPYWTQIDIVRNPLMGCASDGSPCGVLEGTGIVYDCPCTSVELLPPDGKDKCGRCLPEANDTDLWDKLRCPDSKLSLVNNCNDRDCEQSELLLKFNLCFLQIASSDAKGAEAIEAFTNEKAKTYLPHAGSVSFFDAGADGEWPATKSSRVTSELKEYVPTLDEVIANTAVEGRLFKETIYEFDDIHGETWNAQKVQMTIESKIDSDVNPGAVMTVKELADGAGDDAAFDEVLVNFLFLKKLAIRYPDEPHVPVEYRGKLINAFEHNLRFTDQVVEFCGPSGGASNDANDANDLDCPKTTIQLFREDHPDQHIIDPGAPMDPVQELEDQCPDRNVDDCDPYDADITYNTGDVCKTTDGAGNSRAWMCILDDQTPNFPLANVIGPPPPGGFAARPRTGHNPEDQDFWIATGQWPNWRLLIWVEIDGCCTEEGSNEAIGCGCMCVAKEPNAAEVLLINAFAAAEAKVVEAEAVLDGVENPPPEDLQDLADAEAALALLDPPPNMIRCWHGGFTSTKKNAVLCSVRFPNAAAGQPNMRNVTLKEFAEEAVPNKLIAIEQLANPGVAPGAVAGLVARDRRNCRGNNNHWINKDFCREGQSDYKIAEFGLGITVDMADQISQQLVASLAIQQNGMGPGKNYEWHAKGVCAPGSTFMVKMTEAPGVPGGWQASMEDAPEKLKFDAAVGQNAGARTFTIGQILNSRRCGHERIGQELEVVCGGGGCPDEDKQDPDEEGDPEDADVEFPVPNDCEHKEPLIDVDWAIGLYKSGTNERQVGIPDYLDFQHPIELIGDGENDSSGYNFRIYLDADAGASLDSANDDEDGFLFDSSTGDWTGSPLGVGLYGLRTTIHTELFSSSDMTMKAESYNTEQMYQVFPVPSYWKDLVDLEDADGNVLIGDGHLSKNNPGHSKNYGYPGWFGKCLGHGKGGPKASRPYGFDKTYFAGEFLDVAAPLWDSYDNRPHIYPTPKGRPDLGDDEKEQDGFKLSSESLDEKQYFAQVASRPLTAYSQEGLDDEGNKHRHYVTKDGVAVASYDTHKIVSTELRINKAPVIYYKTECAGFLHATKCKINFAKDHSPCSGKPAAMRDGEGGWPRVVPIPPFPEDCPTCESTGDNFDFGAPGIEEEWFVYVIDPDAPQGTEGDSAQDYGIGNFKVGDFILYPGAAKSKKSGGQAADTAHIAQISDILLHFPVAQEGEGLDEDIHPHWKSKREHKNMSVPNCRFNCNEEPCRGLDPEILPNMWYKENWPWIEDMDFGDVFVDAEHPTAHLLICKVFSKENESPAGMISKFPAFPLQGEPVGHEYIVNLSRFGLPPDLSDILRDGQRVSFGGAKNPGLRLANNSVRVRYNDYLKNQVRLKGCMVELETDARGSELKGESKSLHPSPSNHTRWEGNAIKEYNAYETDKLDLSDQQDLLRTLLPIPLSGSTILQDMEAVYTPGGTSGIYVENMSQPYYVKVLTDSQHHYERDQEVVFDAQLEGGVWTVQQMASTKLEKHRYRFTVLPCANICPGADIRKIPPGKGDIAGACGNDSDGTTQACEECDEVRACGSFLRDDANQYGGYDCLDYQADISDASLTIAQPNVVSLSAKSRRKYRTMSSSEIFNINTLPGECEDARVIDNKIELIAENLGVDPSLISPTFSFNCNGNDFAISVISSNTTKFYHTLGYIELHHDEGTVWSKQLGGVIPAECEEGGA